MAYSRSGVPNFYNSPNGQYAVVFLRAAYVSSANGPPGMTMCGWTCWVSNIYDIQVSKPYPTL